MKEIISEFQSHGIRVSIFLEAQEKAVSDASETGTDRIEFYTGHFAKQFKQDKMRAVEPHNLAAKEANRLNLGINAGHDLDLDNLRYYVNNVPNLLEVSIGHALVSDALYFGIQNTIQMYLHQINS